MAAHAGNSVTQGSRLGICCFAAWAVIKNDSLIIRVADNWYRVAAMVAFREIECDYLHELYGVNPD